MNVRVATADSTTTQPAQGVSPREIFLEGLPFLVMVVSALLGVYAWSNYPEVMTAAAAVAGVLAFVAGISYLAVRFGPTPEAMVAMSMSDRELHAAIRLGY